MVNLMLEAYFEVFFPFYSAFKGLSEVRRASSFVTLGCLIIWDFKFKRTENYNFTITTNTSQHVEILSLLDILKSTLMACSH